MGTHGFDSRGKKFDANGNLKGWWQKTAQTEFDKKTQCLVKLYNTYTLKFNGKDIKIDGQKTLTENIADFGGVKAAYRAYKKAVGKSSDTRLPGLEYSPNQPFWISGAYGNCFKYKNENDWKQHVKNDDHAPFSVRTRGMFSNMPDFAEDWKCKPESKMNPNPADIFFFFFFFFFFLRAEGGSLLLCRLPM